MIWRLQKQCLRLRGTCTWDSCVARRYRSSSAEGAARQDSDIDIAVIVDELEGDYLDEQARLYKLRRSVDLRIEPVLIEYGQDKSGFLKEIMDTGYVLYPSAV